MERLRAEGEQRRVALGEKQTPRIHFHQAPDQRRRSLPLPGCKSSHFSEEFFVREIGEERHARLYHAPFVSSQPLRLRRSSVEKAREPPATVIALLG